MTDNLPAVRTEQPAAVVVARDTDSWAQQLPAIVELARSVCGTDFVPEAMRDNVAATAAAILYGREVSLPPMTALGNVNVIKGKPGLSAVIMRAQVLAAGHEIRQDKSDSARCVMSGRRRGTDYWQTVEYTIDDARQAGLLRTNPNYEKNPRRMLRARATSELCELMFADVVRGMPSLEELEDLDDDNPAVPPAKTTRATVQRKPRTKTDDGAAAPAAVPAQPGGVPSAAPSSPPSPPLPGEPGYDQPPADASADQTDDAAGPDRESAGTADAEDGSSPSGAPAASSPDPDQPDEQEQLRKAKRAMHAAFNELGIKDRAERLHITQAIVGRELKSSNDLTLAEAKVLLDALATCKTRDHVEALVQMAEQSREQHEQQELPTGGEQ
jgi:hypothetical protein